MAVGATGDPRLAFRQGRAIALAARRIGIGLAFAPVVDVNTDPRNPIINVRAFGETPGLVARMGSAFIRGCQSAGVLACAKHFPGHGATRTDSHSVLPVVWASRVSAWKTELAPFRAAVKAGVASVMTAHVVFPAFDGRIPATLSKRIVTGILRERLGFRGLVVTDSLRMGGIARGYAEGPAAVAALQAGCDLLLDPRDPVALLEHLEHAVRQGDLKGATVAAALARVRAAKRRIGKGRMPSASDALAYERAVRRDVARRSVTLLRGTLPGSSMRKERSLWVVLDDGAARGAVPAFKALVRSRFQQARFSGKGPVSCAVVAVFAKVRINKGRIAVPAALIRDAKARVKGAGSVTAVLFGSPYVAKDLPRAWSVVAAYSDAPDSLEAGVGALGQG
jgi:beta-glucosidase-like glycosyl hydrolase